ncbi:DUF1573 domain-containing protein [Crocinitomix catalasitica]|uniref:DUF1573 domain-containing protein n=1 Tax=Crocinitomix catalasitica TaxID=184607 RepID=UPI0006869914|nr:DUF1573 domain-containing protein [Crocinitomix catalasitica]
MKRIFLSIATVVVLFSCNNEQDTSSTNSLVATTEPKEGIGPNDVDKSSEMTSIEYLETSYDFGEVQYPGENLHTFKFKNSGNAPLVIKEATASCGCTIPNKPDKPIMPGEYGELDVIFKPKQGQVGKPVTKKITVTANTTPTQTYLEISARVK